MGIEKASNVQYKNVTGCGLRTSYQDGFDNSVSFTVADGNVETFVNVYLTNADTRNLLSSMQYALSETRFQEKFLRSVINHLIEKYNEDYEFTARPLPDPSHDES